jgi:endogenous inhibitor of DNA gyrase (YacG/DUF329 family)
MPAYRCAICRAQVQYDGPLPDLYPFCSPRCRLVDLGLWFRAAYTIDRAVSAEDLPEDGEEDGAGGSDKVTR